MSLLAKMIHGEKESERSMFRRLRATVAVLVSEAFVNLPLRITYRLRRASTLAPSAHHAIQMGFLDIILGFLKQLQECGGGSSLGF